MTNLVAKTMSPLLVQAFRIKGGAKTHGERIGLNHSAPEIAQEIQNLVDACGAYVQGKALLAKSSSELRDNYAAARLFLTTYRDILKPSFGTSYSQAWDVTGFERSLTIPSLRDLILNKVGYAARFLAENPRFENPLLNITATRAQQLNLALQNGLGAVNTQTGQAKELLEARNTAATRLRKRVRSVIEDLKRVLDPLDPNWVVFGLNQPGAKKKPEAPENVTAEVVLENQIAVKWEAAPRAEYYRVWQKAESVDAEFVPVATVYDPDFTFEDVSPNTPIEIAVSAVNNGGESRLSESVRLGITAAETA